ncbi:MAG: nuclear transport factor 2 family protein [Hyphomicrobium sp.]
MVLRLSKPIDIYFASENAHDVAALEECLAADAVVVDEHKTIRGLAAIKAWRTETGEKYAHSIEPIAVSEDAGKVAVRCRVTGNFPGSPIELDHIFSVRDGLITALEIR